MSARDTFKPIAVVTAIGIAFLGLTAIPAQATGTPINLVVAATNITGSGTVATQIAGPGNSVSISNTGVVGPSALPVYFTVSGGTTTSGTVNGTLAAGATVNIATPTAGTITVLGYAITNGVATASATDTIIITVVTSVPGTIYASSTVLAAPSTNLPTPATDATFSVVAPSGASNVANFTVTELDAQGNVMLPANAKVISVLATNALVSSPNLAASPLASASIITGIPVNPTTDFVLSGINGYGGSSTISISVNNVLVKTYSVKFTGSAVTLKLIAINNVVGIGSAYTLLPNTFVPTGITANVNALEVQELDAQGNIIAINPSHISVTSSTPAIATTGIFDSADNYTLGNIPGGTPTSPTALGVSINGVAAGTTTFSVTDTSIGLNAPPVTIRVSSGVPTSVVISANSSKYDPGSAGTLTTTLSDAAGPLPAGTYVVFTGQAVASLALSGGQAQLPGVAASTNGPSAQKIGQVTIGSNGSYTDSFNAPATPGQVTISAAPISSSIAVTPATFTVVGADAAPDAQAEASDSAAALDDTTTSATASGDAADKPGVDAAALATTAQTQITAFTALVTTVLNKAAALAKSVAAINKKIGKK